MKNIWSPDGEMNEVIILGLDTGAFDIAEILLSS